MRYAVGEGHFRHGLGRIERVGAVVEAGKDVAMNINHAKSSITHASRDDNEARTKPMVLCQESRREWQFSCIRHGGTGSISFVPGIPSEENSLHRMQISGKKDKRDGLVFHRGTKARTKSVRAC